MSKPVAIVTGAGSGIGEAVATHLYGKGFKVVVADLNPSSGEHVASALGPDAYFIESTSHHTNRKHSCSNAHTNGVATVWTSAMPMQVSMTDRTSLRIWTRRSWMRTAWSRS